MAITPLLVSLIGGYLLGSIPVAVLVMRVHGVDPRDVGDRNPGFWNVREQFGPRAAAPVFAGDLGKGLLAGLLGLMVSGWHVTERAAGPARPAQITPAVAGAPVPPYAAVTGPSTVPVYSAVAAAMIGHAWPVFAGFRGGRSVLTFAGGIAIVCPPAFGLSLAVLTATSLVTRSFAIGARAGVFAVPLLQLPFAPAAQVASTGALMCLIGLRFGQAARRRRPPGRR